MMLSQQRLAKARQQMAIILAGLSSIALVTSLAKANTNLLKPIVSQSAVRVTNLTPKSTPKTDSLSERLRQRQQVAIYSGRFEVTAHASERAIRARVRNYRARGFNTIVQGVWGNGCAMYESAVTKKLLGQAHCQNDFNSQWLDWMLDEASKQGVEVHAYFETGIKITPDSQIYALAQQRGWLLPGVDTSDPKQVRYVFDVSNPEVVNLFQSVMTEFVRKYPQVKAVQWDDYLAYSDTLPGGDSEQTQVERGEKLTKFVNNLVRKTKQAQPSVRFDLAIFNPSWAKNKYAADWEKNWQVDRVFIEAYNERDFDGDLNCAKTVSGIVIGDNQLHRLPAVIGNPQISRVSIFPLHDGKPQSAVDRFAGHVKASR